MQVRTTVSVDDRVLRSLRVRAARDGVPDSQVIERALRRELGLELIDQLWERASLSESEATDLVTEALREVRARKG
jgi:hypothetical protein